jgi:hypothetical protein
MKKIWPVTAALYVSAALLFSSLNPRSCGYAISMAVQETGASQLPQPSLTISGSYRFVTAYVHMGNRYSTRCALCLVGPSSIRATAYYAILARTPATTSFKADAYPPGTPIYPACGKYVLLCYCTDPSNDPHALESPDAAEYICALPPSGTLV